MQWERNVKYINTVRSSKLFKYIVKSNCMTSAAGGPTKSIFFYTTSHGSACLPQPLPCRPFVCADRHGVLLSVAPLCSVLMQNLTCLLYILAKDNVVINCGEFRRICKIFVLLCVHNFHPYWCICTLCACVPMWMHVRVCVYVCVPMPIRCHSALADSSVPFHIVPGQRNKTQNNRAWNLN